MGGQVELLENFGEEHDQVDDGGDHDNSAQFIEDLFFNFKGRGGIDDSQYHGD